MKVKDKKTLILDKLMLVLGMDLNIWELLADWLLLH
jgi:hypothetical protein